MGILIYFFAPEGKEWGMVFLIVAMGAIISAFLLKALSRKKRAIPVIFAKLKRRGFANWPWRALVFLALVTAVLFRIILLMSFLLFFYVFEIATSLLFFNTDSQESMQSPVKDQGNRAKRFRE